MTLGSTLDSTITKFEEQLKLWSAKLDVVVAKGEVAKEESKIEAHKRVDELKSKLAAARVKLDEAKAAGADKWDSFKGSVESSWKDLEGAFHKLTH